MKIIPILSVIFFCSCNSKKTNFNAEFVTDTAVDVRSVNKNYDTIKIKVDTLFMGYRADMSNAEFQKHTDELVSQQKLFRSGKEIVYKVEVRNDLFFEDIINKNRKEIKKIQYGFLNAEFFHDSLLALTISFGNPSMQELYPYFHNLLNKKYYESYDLSALKNKDDTSKSTLQYNKWRLNNTLITLWEKPNSKLLPKVVLKYECISCNEKKQFEANDLKEKAESKIKEDI